MRSALLAPLLLGTALAAAPSSSSSSKPAAKQGKPAATKSTAKAKPATPAEAEAFAKQLNVDLRRLWTKQATAEWIKSTYITDDTERNAATVNEEVLGYTARAIKEAARFVGLKLDPETERMLYLLRVSSSLVSPDDPNERQEMASILAKMEGLYGKGKYCGVDGKAKCRDLGELTEVLAKSRNYADLLDAWTGWHSISRDMRPLYQRFVELANKGSRSIGFAEAGAMWRSAYDMTPDAFEKDTDRLWQQVRPLYEDLHCKVRTELARTYGKDKVPADQPIPAHLLGNMWAQEWGNVYSLVEPYKNVANLDVDAALVAQKYDAVRMVKLGESFFTSLGFDPLPKTFWQRSQFTKPRDRDVVCHASAWDVSYNDDLRIKMCIKVNEEDLITIHHELGHDYYFHSYFKLPVLFQQGANDGFHEAIGDALTLSITPAYLKQVGLITAVPADQKGLINFQMKTALEKIAFLPFGKLIDQWRWDLFSGKTKPEDYNKAWWELRRKYQGVAPAVARSEADFDPGAKYHVAANVPYTRYFLARILQFQFHRALCQAAGHKGPLHECSIYGNQAAGEKLRKMLELGASKPWPEALFAITGQRELDATALLDYFAPLQAWLKEQNKGQKCGW